MGEHRILFVVTNHSPIAANYFSGLWFSQLAFPYRLFAARSYSITVASPRGGVAPVDPRSMPRPETLESWMDVLQLLLETRVLAELTVDAFDAIFLAGGHGAMYDLPHCVALHQLLHACLQADKPIAAVCHGVAGLIGAAGLDGQPLVAGRRITAFTDAEEQETRLDRVLPFLLERELRARGANFIAQASWADHIEQDGLLITGQNPQSSTSAARAVIAALEPTPDQVEQP